MDSQGRIYGAYGRYFAPYAIYEINPQTGLATFVVQTNFIGIRAMAFDDNDVLYISNERDAPLSLSPTDLHTLDLNTGSSTLIGEIGSNLMYTMDFWDGKLWAYAWERGLIQVDINTAQPTDVNQAFIGPWDFASVTMTFDDAGALHYVDTNLWMMDTQTGVASAVTPLSLFGYWADAVFVKGPAPNFSLWFSGTTEGTMAVKFSGATPDGQVAIAWAQGSGGPTSIPAGFGCSGVELNLNSSMQLLGTLTANGQGEGFLGPRFVPASARGQIRVQAIDLFTCATSNPVVVVY